MRRSNRGAGALVPILVALLAICGCNGANEAGDQIASEVGDGGSEDVSVDRDPTKWALLIGINQYGSSSVSNLRGCVNDVSRVRALLLSKFEYPEENILTLTDEQATRENIIEAFQSHLIANAISGDAVVVQYSGHGSQMKDADGEETDRWDETIVPHDSRTEGVFDISDDELNGLLQLISEKTRNVTLILDSCHSGTGTRAAGLARRIDPDLRDPPPPASFARSSRGTEPGSLRQEDVDYVLLAAARADQLAFEHVVDGENYGAFTYFLTEELARAEAGATYRDIMDLVIGRVGSLYTRQTPQLEGTRQDAFVFSDSTSLGDPYFLVAPERSGKVKVEAGEVHGVTQGSIFEVYAPGTKRFEPPATPLARIEIDSVGSYTSVASVIDGGSAVAGARAVEREHAFPDQKFRVHFMNIESSPTLQSMKGRLDTLNHIAFVPEPRGYQLLLRQQDGRLVFEAADTTMLSPPVRIRGESDIDEATRLVEEWARWFNLLDIENSSSRLKVDVSLSATGTLSDGDPLTCTVTNRSDVPLFISVMDISTDGSVAVVFDDRQPLPPGQSKDIELEVFVPPERDSVRDFLRVFATRNPIDLEPLTQPPIAARGRLTRGELDPLQALLAQASVGTTRGSRERLKTDDWAVVDRTFVVRRVE